ncbi:MAG: GNAT family N-acetyltransferase [Prolixibacteraceae bacterium]|jgi:diamine N-acetyltransferase|nr:GNAT family N-acetyltransferase [Prolixibacteraceae bacterium]MDI9564849.1 GNAT family N-acetyltransferase [Bacteroidota bacterium]NLT00840.1 GNAT family N-acetyltransferase [Bacteroidales bacterium]OQB79448.1 MAG: Acetyltransferase (GNAT) family protein [Bacteroidetes bacterium ADurb.Bin123]HNZ69072.1 GNAT family N-acetyltransferase [Prolixibacteraceae bacterium]
MNNDILAYGNVVLRALEPEDLDLLYEWENDSSLWELSNTKAPFSRHILASYLQNATPDIYEQKQVRLIIQSLQGKAVGAVDLFDIDLFHQRAGVGILIHKKEDRRHGYASDALKAFENYAQEIVGVRQLYANIAEDNSESIELFQKAGYHLTGIRKKWLNTLRGWKDEWFFQKILRDPPPY